MDIKGREDKKRYWRNRREFVIDQFRRLTVRDDFVSAVNQIREKWSLPPVGDSAALKNWRASMYFYNDPLYKKLLKKRGLDKMKGPIDVTDLVRELGPDTRFNRFQRDIKNLQQSLAPSYPMDTLTEYVITLDLNRVPFFVKPRISINFPEFDGYADVVIHVAPHTIQRDIQMMNPAIRAAKARVYGRKTNQLRKSPNFERNKLAYDLLENGKFSVKEAAHILEKRGWKASYSEVYDWSRQYSRQVGLT